MPSAHRPIAHGAPSGSSMSTGQVRPTPSHASAASHSPLDGRHCAPIFFGASCACELGHAAACFSHGAALAQSEDAVAPDPTRALELLEKGCRLGHGYACNFLGDRLIAKDRQRRDLGWLADLEEHACRQGENNTCVALLRRVERGEGLPADLARARAIRDFMCRQGNGAVCLELAAVLRGEGDRAGELAALDRSCGVGTIAGCRQLTRALVDAELSDEDPRLVRARRSTD